MKPPRNRYLDKDEDRWFRRWFWFCVAVAMVVIVVLVGCFIIVTLWLVQR